MGLFDTAKGAIAGNKAYRAHVDAGKLAGEGKMDQARAKYREALRLYEEARQLGNDSPNIALAHALLLMREGEFERAMDMMRQISRKKGLSDDDWFQLRMQYSICLWRTGRLDEAIDTIGRAAAYKMTSGIYGTLGMYWVDRAKQTGVFDEALTFNRKAIEYDDEDAAALDNMGQLYEAMAGIGGAGERTAEYRTKALEYYEKAYEQKPRQITTIYCLARMLHQNGDDARARKLLSNLDLLNFSAMCPISRQMMEDLAREVG